ncbi:MAG: hypothetical protein ABIZ95_08770 [Pyrinomonadaceae bacterium]
MNTFTRRLTLLIVMFCVLAIPTTAQKVSREQLAEELTALRQQMAVIDKALLAPGAEDLLKYAAFTQGSESGVIRLMPRGNPPLVSSIREGGAYYSFTDRSHEYGAGSAIALENDHFLTGFAGANFGFLKMIGDVRLEALTTESESVRALVNFVPPQSEAGARVEQGKFHARSDALYVDRLEAKVDQTYVVRSVSYGHSDTMTAFRVVRKDTDGSLIMVWKMLRRYPVPQLDRYASESRPGN